MRDKQPLSCSPIDLFASLDSTEKGLLADISITIKVSQG